jgi:hypothetical protein
VQASSNLVDWISLSTNYPAGGAFSFPASQSIASPGWFYRSSLQP